jgi:hypothetical protein
MPFFFILTRLYYQAANRLSTYFYIRILTGAGGGRRAARHKTGTGGNDKDAAFFRGIRRRGRLGG